MAANLYWFIVGILFLLGIWAAVMFYKYPSWALAMLLPLLAWLLFDPLVLALGNGLGEGATLQALSYLRYLLRALATPFLLVVAFDQAKRLRVKWTEDPLTLLLLSVVILALVVLGVVKGFLGFTLEPVVHEGIKQYKEDTPLGLPLAAIVTMALIAVLGVGVFLKARAPWLLGGALLVLLGLLAPLATVSWPAVVLAASSVALVLGFLLTERKLQEVAPNPAVR
jgi:O-antigen ligase